MDPGLLYVTMQPEPGLPPDQFHEWYNNEHGPTRLRLPQIFSSGLRFRATDAAEPAFLAVYDVASMRLLQTPTYTDLRANRSDREAATIDRVHVVRSFLDLLYFSEVPGFRPAEQLPGAGDDKSESDGRVLVSVSATLTEADGAEAEVRRWYEQEHIPMLAKVPGWLRSRVFRDGSSSPAKLISLHEYAPSNGLGGPEHKASMATSWRDHVFARFIAAKGRRTYSLFYVFGPAPRDLDSLSRLPATAAFSDGKTSTTPSPSASISSFVTAADGLEIPYRLEGNPSPTAPTVAFCNSLLTSLHMWDPFVALLAAHRPDLRILRYDHRGRSAVSAPVMLDRLSDDLAGLLDALRIRRLHALVGVSLGGATALRFALAHPARVGRVLACDFNVAGSPANTAAWKERVQLAESVGTDGRPGIETLAGLTVERWFHPHTLAEKKEVARWMTDMVAANDVEGFRYGCQALWDYDLRGEMGSLAVPALLAAGEGDAKGALVAAMDGFRGGVGAGGAELKLIPLAGHLPMCESPRDFWQAVGGFF